MKPSPVQLLQSTIETISVEANALYDPEQAVSTGEDVQLQVKEACEPFSAYWDGQALPVEGIEQRTFMVRLSIRTESENVSSIPYRFDLVFSGVVACFPEKLNGFTPAATARQYGFAMIYGAMREQFLTLTSRMPHGARLLPTVSFMEPDAKAPDTDEPGTEAPAKKSSARSKQATAKRPAAQSDSH